MIIRFSFTALILSLLLSNGVAQNTPPNNRKIVLGYAIQDNGATEYEFAEITGHSDSTQELFKKREIVFRYQDEPEEWHNLGFIAKKMKPLFKQNEEANKEFKKYRRRIFFGNAIMIGGITSAIAIYIGGSEYALIAILGELAVTGTSGTLLLKNDEKHIIEATLIYNKNIK